MQKSTGSEDFTNGSQNCFSAGGRDVYQIAVEAPASTSISNATANFLPLNAVRTGERQTQTRPLNEASEFHLCGSAILLDLPTIPRDVRARNTVEHKIQRASTAEFPGCASDPDNYCSIRLRISAAVTRTIGSVLVS